MLILFFPNNILNICRCLLLLVLLCVGAWAMVSVWRSEDKSRASSPPLRVFWGASSRWQSYTTGAHGPSHRSSPRSFCFRSSQFFTSFWKKVLIFFKLEFLFLFCSWVFCLHVCMCNTYIPDPLRGTKENIRSSGTRIIQGWELPCRCRKSNQGPL